MTENDLELGEVDHTEDVDFPPSERTIHTQGYDLSLNTLDEQWADGTLIIPDFQREYVWDNKAELKSKLIESVLLKVPIPVIYTAEMPDGREVVVDGQQRLTTLREFCKIDGFKLSKLKILEDLNRKGYSSLPSELQERIDFYKIRVVKILQTSHPDIKFEVFERLNKGSVKLNDQELRNCIYRGNFNEFLKKLVDNSDFLKLQNLEEPDKRMKDVERVLRFFAFCEKGVQNYKSPIRSFLNNFNEDKREVANNKELEEKKEMFKKCVELCKAVFGDLTGRRWMRENENDDSNKAGVVSKTVNEGIFDAQMVGFMDYEKRQILPKAQMIRDAFIQLSTKWWFIDTVVLGTYDTKKTKIRISKWQDKLRDIVDTEEKERRFFTYDEKQKLFKLPNGNVCALCKNRIIEIDDAQVDHKIPYSKGGKTEIENAQLTHIFCNQSKNKKLEVLQDIDFDEL